MKSRILAAVTVLALFGFARTGLAMHDGGAGHCDACHTMHNSQNNAAVTDNPAGQFDGYPFLLKGADQSSTCLECHGASGVSSYHIATPETVTPGGNLPGNKTPGGDFAWLKVNYVIPPRSGPGPGTPEPADSHGHNIVAADFSSGYMEDGTIHTSPGGTYPANKLACSSCHDPHGKYRVFADGSVGTTGLPISGSGSTGTAPVAGVSAVGTYRLLAGIGYEPGSTLGHAFVNGPPAAIAPSTYNQTEATNQVHVAYGSGMSEWCANCHGEMLQNGYVSGAAHQTHPAGNNAKLGAEIAGNYNAYVHTGDLTGSSATSFLSLVQYETDDNNSPAGRLAMKNMASSTKATDAGPNAQANVMCLSCHRAHASGFPDMLRFSETLTFITDGAGYVATAGRTSVDWEAAYYGRPYTKFGTFQRPLCNKCHAKD